MKCECSAWWMVTWTWRRLGAPQPNPDAPTNTHTVQCFQFVTLPMCQLKYIWFPDCKDTNWILTQYFPPKRHLCHFWKSSTEALWNFAHKQTNSVLLIQKNAGNSIRPKLSCPAGSSVFLAGFQNQTSNITPTSCEFAATREANTGSLDLNRDRNQTACLQW